MHSIMSVKLASRPRPSGRSLGAPASQETLEEKMNTSFLSCSIEEEDLLDNIEMNLVSAALTDSSSSHFSSDLRSYGDRFEVSGADQGLRRAREPTDEHGPALAVDSLDDPMCSHQTRPKLSLSMHDLSKIPSFPLVSKPSNFSSETIQSQSITTVGSCPKSKDSGFPRSLSCLSLNSGRSYEHVQSKVKEYIKQIKAGNVAKRKLTYEGETNEGTEGGAYEESTSPQVLVPMINRLKDELEEKDRMLLKLQENYDALLMKYAAAENRIDHLRVNSVGNLFDIPPTDYKKPKASPNMLLLPNLCDLQKESNCLDFRLESPCGPSPARPSVRPVTNSTCLVERMEEDIVPRLQNLPFQTTVVSKERNGRYSLHQNRETNRESERVEIEPHRSADPESPNENQTTTPNNGDRTRPLNYQLENPIVKVKRWQESLPSLHLIEPSIYDQFADGDAGSKLFHEKKKDKPVWTLSENNGSNVIVELSVSDEIEPVGEQPSKEESGLSESGNPLPLFITSPSDVCLNDTDTELDALKNLSDDLSCHTSHSKDTKDVCRTSDSRSVSTSVDGSSTFLCLESASNLSSAGQECARNESSSVPAQNKPYIHLSAQENDNTHNNSTQNYLPPIILPRLHKHHLPTLPVIQPITKRHLSSESTSSILSYISKETGESNSWCRKRLLGQKARLLLMDYLKLKHSGRASVCCTKDNCNHLPGSCYTHDSQISKECKDSFEDKNVSLVQCLDEMNQCAQKLRGKSEAIMEVLAKQLKES